MAALKKRVIERALAGELTHHLGYEHGEKRAQESANSRNGYPPEIRKMIYMSNAIESLHMQLRKVLKNRGHFRDDEAASKLIYLA